MTDPDQPPTQSDSDCKDSSTVDNPPPTSGLRNPAAAARGVGAATLLLEALVLLLALVPLVKLSGRVSGAQIGILLGLVALCVLTCAVLKRAWGWHVGTVIQVAVMATGFFNWALLVLGVVFLAIWLYVLHVRRTLTRPARFTH
ncbi:DUF4233 domain-containing protein [Fodinicola acaciae]|uniref:DUF4233 domain-containing protein n=1 Tax=Fodinicola acaciae TaxID=2681555 RepID=UPI0013CF6A0C|nr:DUF4233 domain-containing protein [Fodinicola acaciae]